MRYTLLAFTLSILSLAAKAQSGPHKSSPLLDSAFYTWLNAQQRHERCLQWLDMYEKQDSLPQNKEWLFCQKAQHFSALGNYPSALGCLNKSRLHYSASKARHACALSLLCHDTASSAYWQGQLPASYWPSLHAVAFRQPIPAGTNPELWSDAAFLVKRYQEYKPKKIGIAIACSILPGGGKWYLGKKQQAVSSLIINTILACTAIESYNKKGPQSFMFISSASIFALFYGGNIWGSATLARKQNYDHFKQLDSDLAIFCSALLAADPACSTK